MIVLHRRVDRGRPWTTTSYGQAIDNQRRYTVAMLGSLTDDEWKHPSLCAGWTVRDVAAHLTLQQIGFLGALKLAAPTAEA